MTAALAPTPTYRHPPVPPRPRLRVAVRPAPRREPPFDDELTTAPVVGRHDRRLPFETPPAGPCPEPLTTLRPHGLPEPTRWGRRLLVGLVETADGRRPLQQLAGMLSPSVARGLAIDFEQAAQDGTRHWLHDAAVQTVRAGEPAAGVAELCATVRVGPRVRALALRIEAHRGRWRCTRLQLG